jgi:hypothetical protein
LVQSLRGELPWAFDETIPLVDGWTPNSKHNKDQNLIKTRLCCYGIYSTGPPDLE